MVPFSLGILGAVVFDRVKGGSPSNRVLFDMLLFGAVFTVAWETVGILENWEVLASV